MDESDAIIISAARDCECEALDALDALFTSLGKPMFTLGPLLPPDYGSEVVVHERNREVGNFLDATLAKYGEKSLLFVRPFHCPFDLVCLHLFDRCPSARFYGQQV
jgi:hypothetical protein